MVELKVFCRAAASALIIFPLTLLFFCEKVDAEVWMLSAHIDDAAIAAADLGISFGDLPGGSLKGAITDNADEGFSLSLSCCETGMRAVVSEPLFDLTASSVKLFAAGFAGSNFSSLTPDVSAFFGTGNDTAFFDFARGAVEFIAANLTGQKWAFLHTQHFTSLDVIKPSLIDLEAQAWATGGKVTAAAYRPERLSGMGTIECMRQSGLPYNARLKREREIEASPRHETVVTKVTECKYYSGYETLDIAPSDTFTAAEYNWKQAAVAVSASGLEVDVQNSGKERVINLLEKRISNAFKTMKNQISSGIYSDGTGSGGKQITGLQALVADDPTTGTVGGISRDSWSFWQNQMLTNATMSASVIQGYMQTLWVQCIRGADKPDLITADAYCYGYYWDGLQAIQRITSTEVGQQGWNSLKFLNADVIYDGDSGHPNYGMYFLNTDYLYFRPHVNRNFVPLEQRDAVNQDAFIVPVVFAGNLTMSNASLQGVLLKTGR